MKRLEETPEFKAVVLHAPRKAVDRLVKLVREREGRLAAGLVGAMQDARDAYPMHVMVAQLDEALEGIAKECEEATDDVDGVLVARAIRGALRERKRR